MSTLIIGIINKHYLMLLVASIFLGSPSFILLAAAANQCFGADDGGRNGILYNAVRDYVEQECPNNNNCTVGQTYGWPMNSWCVGSVTDMSDLFYDMSTFNEDISGWDVSNVMTMEFMFDSASSFNGDLSAWDTKRVTNMFAMFQDATSFNGDLSALNTSSVTDMRWMFYDATSFNGNLSAWDISSVISMYGMFSAATSFNGDLSSWNTKRVTEMELMFNSATSFNQDLCAWRDAFPYNDATNIFADSGCTYQDDPQEDQKGPFCASECTPTTRCFAADDGGFGGFGADDGNEGILHNAVRDYMSQDCPADNNCTIAQTYGWPMNSWCVGKVTDMTLLFYDMYTFNEDISGWDVSNVMIMEGMFRATSFNGDLSSWNTKSVTTMSDMFQDATSFNGDLSAWNTSSVTSMSGMFRGATSFNSDLSAWNTKSVIYMGYMFNSATSFNQDLCAWRDAFPYNDADNMFTAYEIFANSGCTYQDDPDVDQKGPFCASDCANPTTVETTPVPEIFSECTDTPNYLDTWGGGCADYELQGNEAWCGGYGNMGEEGNTPNENCCVCKALVVDSNDEGSLSATTSAPTQSPATASAPTQSPENEISNPSSSPSTKYPTSLAPYASFGSLSEVCSEESVAFQSCDLDGLDDVESSLLDCSMCSAEALGDDFDVLGDDLMSFNNDLYCERWNTCVTEKCSESCKDPLYAYQKCLFEEDDGIALNCYADFPDGTTETEMGNDPGYTRPAVTPEQMFGEKNSSAIENPIIPETNADDTPAPTPKSSGAVYNHGPSFTAAFSSLMILLGFY